MATWLDEMPPLPWARWVPYVPGTVGGPCPGNMAGVPNLDEPQGFGHALRRGVQLGQPFLLALGRAVHGHPVDGRDSWSPEMDALTVGHMLGTTTDADRLALARGWREVAS